MEPLKDWTDEEIRKGVLDNLYWDERLRDVELSVTVESGNVTLRGELTSFREWSAVLDRVCEIPGVLRVNDELTVSSAEPSSPADDGLRGQIEEALAADAAIGGSRIEVQANRGLVTLRGTVDSAWKKPYVENVAALAEGVFVVRNDIAVVPVPCEPGSGSGPGVRDVELAGRVAEAICVNLPLGSETVKVSVLNGVAVLSGSIPHPSVRELAQAIAARVPGVSCVKDELALTQ